MGTLQVSFQKIQCCQDTWEETLSIQVLSKNSVFELFSLVVDNLRHTIINYYHIMKITGNFDSSLF